MYSPKGASTYASVGVETGVMSASPHQLIVMLFDGALAAIKKARWALDNGDIATRGNALSKAINIVDNGLKNALDLEKGGEIAENLYSLYDFVSRSLVKVNRTRDVELLDRIEHIMADIAGAWKEIGPQAAAQQSPFSAAQA
ncbi:flagellar export chaperone FliS [Kushneria aurantia]|uniref:Flagellar secretion chaperone FliS n=1 Tax=Kushneria aurantia TaxID=504092 RepID=A0ABV6G115_9GAMM|nr:flagellar export chaperone FliS [Kushneria aurantia]